MGLKITKMSEKENLISEFVKNIPLETRIRVTLQMNDIEKFKNGTYYGDIEELLNSLLEEVEEWIEDGADLRDEKYLK